MFGGVREILDRVSFLQTNGVKDVAELRDAAEVWDVTIIDHP